MSRLKTLATIPLLLFSCSSPDGAPQPRSPAVESAPLRMNHLQILGSHNSYKQDLDRSLKLILDDRTPQGVKGLEYSHVSLTRQLDLGLRKLELDVFYDPEGRRYADPRGIRLVADRGMPAGPPFDTAGVMANPGFKVLHVQDIDFRSSCLTLVECLEEIGAWSDANPDHVPIVITVNAKDGQLPWPGFVTPLKFDSTAFDALDREIAYVLGNERLLTPDKVRGDRESLEEAVTRDGWPMIDEVRGAIMFVLDEVGEKQETYLEGHPALRGRVMFVNAEEGRPEAAFRIVNDPIKDGNYIRELVLAGYLVRTRADAGTHEARSGSYERLEAAIRSGANYISTDYYLPDALFGHDFHVQLPGGKTISCNPVNAPPDCDI